VSGGDRLGRLLVLVPYLLARPGIRITEAADDLGVSEDQLRDDLQLLYVCGLPGYGPGDLIDMSVADDTVTITYHAGMDRPLRLNGDEAMALIVALRALAGTDGNLDGSYVDGDAVARALAKLETAAGAAGKSASRVAVTEGLRDAGMAGAVRGALDRGRALRIVYYTAGRDATTERVVDPIRLRVVEGYGYLEAWCRRVEAVRMFRLDRIDALTELDEPSAPPASAESRDGLFTPEPDAPLVALRVGLRSRWITEYYPCEEVVAEPGGRWAVTLRANDLEWARRMVVGLGDDAEVLGPPELITLIRSRAEAALAVYTEYSAEEGAERWPRRG
jgi:proteasome accessory factor C